MRFETAQCGKFRVVRIRDSLTIHDNPRELKQIASDLLSRGIGEIAFSFTPDTFMSSRLLAVLVACCRLAHKEGGEIAVVAANEKMHENFQILNIAHENCFRIVLDETELLSLS